MKMAHSRLCCSLSSVCLWLLGLTDQVFSIWAIMSCRFATSASICKCVTNLLFHGAGVSGLGLIEFCTLASLLLKLGRDRCVGSTISVIIALIFVMQMAEVTDVSGLWELVS